MFPLGHLGITAAVGHLLSRTRYFPWIDYRILLVGAFLPDLIDKPIGFIFGMEGRSLAHGLLFNAGLTLLVLLPWLAPSRRQSALGTPLVWLLPLLALGSWIHLLLDRIWEQPWVFFWPFLGAPRAPEAGIEQLFLALPYYLEIPYIIAGEVIGGLLLIGLVVKYGLYRGRSILQLLRTGKMVAR